MMPSRMTIVSFWMDKRHYSAFSGTDLDIRLRERRVTTVVLTGVLTDICVLGLQLLMPIIWAMISGVVEGVQQPPGRLKPMTLLLGI